MPRAIGAVDIEGVVEQVDIDKLVSEVDLDKVLERVDIQALMGRIDLNALLERVDLTTLLDQIDLDALVARLDVNALVNRLDVDAVVAKVDVDGLIKKVDVNGLVQQVDVDGLVKQVDVDGLVQQVDVGALVGRVDLDALMQQVDIDALLDRIDMPELMRRAQIDAIVSNASRGVVTRMLDAVRRQLVGVDLVLGRIVNRVLRRPQVRNELPQGTVTGQLAGGISRLAAWLVDAGVISVTYSLLVSLAVFLVGLFSGEAVQTTDHEWLWAAGYVVFGFLYYWVGLTVTGRSIGKGVIGLRVLGPGAVPISPGRAAVRTIVYPFSFILGLGLIPIVTSRNRRALHDAAARSTVVYDWGDRPSQMPAPVTDWLRRHEADTRPDEPLTPVTGLVVVDTTSSSKTA